MIQSHYFAQYRNAEFIQQGKDLSSIVANANPTALGIKKQHDAFAAQIAELEEVFKTSQKNPLTETLVALDEKRDRIFMGFCFMVDGYLKHWNATTVAQATLLINSINVYGREIVISNYQAESASISSLVDSWEKNSELIAAITALNLASWKDELKATNDLFITTYTNRSQADGNAEALPKIKILRERTMGAWEKLVNIVVGKTEEFADDEAKAPAYHSLVNSINGVLDSYATLLSMRQAKKTAKNKPNNTEPTV